MEATIAVDGLGQGVLPLRTLGLDDALIAPHAALGTALTRHA